MANNNNSTNMMELILNQEVDINHQNKDGITPLMVAAHRGNLECVKQLIEHNADIHLKSNQGETALTLAEKNNHTDIRDLLLEAERAQNAPSLR